MNKKELRKICLERRDTMSEEERSEASFHICQILLPLLQKKTVLSYYPFRSEVSLSYLNHFLPVAYPYCKEDNEMDALVPKYGHFKKNRYGIMEPDPEKSILIPKEKIDVVLVPCVGFDESGTRLGHGGGYYDRYLKDCPAFKIGIAFECQKVEELEADEWDIPLDMIITEKSRWRVDPV